MGCHFLLQCVKVKSLSRAQLLVPISRDFKVVVMENVHKAAALFSIDLLSFGCARSLSLHWLFSSCRERGLLSFVVLGFLTVVVSLVAEHRL